MNLMQRKTAPITDGVRAELRASITAMQAVAKRKNLMFDRRIERVEAEAARNHFDLGCWLFFYSRKVGQVGPEGFAARVDCARRIFLDGITNPRYDFFTIFDFGEREFDTIFEMGDAEAVVEALRREIPNDRSGRIAKGLRALGLLPSGTLRLAA